jgi:hypothetical protein
MPQSSFSACHQGHDMQDMMLKVKAVPQSSFSACHQGYVKRGLCEKGIIALAMLFQRDLQDLMLKVKSRATIKLLSVT